MGRPGTGDQDERTEQVRNYANDCAGFGQRSTRGPGVRGEKRRAAPDMDTDIHDTGGMGALSGI